MNRVRAAVILALLLVLACGPRESSPPIKGARGNEPFWAVTLDGNGATFRAPDLPNGINYREGRWRRREREMKWVYKARRERAEGLWLELEVREAPCTDSMSGEAFAYQAIVTFEDRQMEGCAG